MLRGLQSTLPAVFGPGTVGQGPDGESEERGRVVVLYTLPVRCADSIPICMSSLLQFSLSLSIEIISLA
jgi:hypothetical protein